MAPMKYINLLMPQAIEMNKNLTNMLNQSCPQCKSEAGDIITYMPVIKDGMVEIEIACENCGCYGKFIGKITTTKFKPSIGPDLFGQE